MECVPDDSWGEEVTDFKAPLGYKFSARLEANQSTTFQLRNPSGNVVFEANSGIYGACTLLGFGSGLMISTFSRNSSIGAITAALISKGCRAVVSMNSDDGDAYSDVPRC